MTYFDPRDARTVVTTQQASRDRIAAVIDLMPIAAHLVNWPALKGENRYQARVCPLCALAREIDPTFRGMLDFTGAGRVLGLTDEEAMQIACAADNVSVDAPLELRQLRQALVQALR